MARIRPMYRRSRKLYELVCVLLRNRICPLCLKPLALRRKFKERCTYYNFLRQFDRYMIYELTVHHNDENRNNNEAENHWLVHETCHKSHHLKKRHADRRATKLKAGTYTATIERIETVIRGNKKSYLDATFNIKRKRK